MISGNCLQPSANAELTVIPMTGISAYSLQNQTLTIGIFKEDSYLKMLERKCGSLNVLNESPVQVRCMNWMLGAGALGRPRGMVWGGRREEGSGWGTHVYLWQIHFDIWQNQYSIVK